MKEALVTNNIQREIDCGQACAIIADDERPGGRTYLMKKNDTQWSIVLPGEEHVISIQTFRKLATEQLIVAERGTEYFVPVRH